MKKVLDKIKSYHPPKYICLLYFFVPIFICTVLNLSKENDIWFLLNHGKYVLQHGFPIIEPFTMHQGFSFVMQQWLSSVIFYLSYHFLGRLGLLMVIEIVNIFILYFLYKLCMLISNNRYFLSTILSIVTDLLLLTSFMIPRPQIFTYLLLIITLYLMELFYLNKSKRCIYFLPLLSLLQINFHASMWFMIFLFILPYFVCLVLNKRKDKKDMRIFILLGVILVMFLVGFLNPYGIKSITYIFNSYGVDEINMSVVEMFPPVISGNYQTVQGILTFLVLGFTFLIYIVHKRGKLQLRYILLLGGVTILGLMNIRSLSLLIIGSIPFLSFYLKDLERVEKIKKIPKCILKNYYIIGGFLIICIVVVAFFQSSKGMSNSLEKGIDVLLKRRNLQDIILYTNYDNGSYAEYRGLKPYIDTRAEVFLKANNKKEDIMYEYFLLCYNMLDYNKFIKKYQFTHLIVMKNEALYQHVSKDKRFHVIYKEKKYKIFERIKK